MTWKVKTKIKIESSLEDLRSFGGYDLLISFVQLKLLPIINSASENFSFLYAQKLFHFVYSVKFITVRIWEKFGVSFCLWRIEAPLVCYGENAPIKHSCCACSIFSTYAFINSYEREAEGSSVVILCCADSNVRKRKRERERESWKAILGQCKWICPYL